MSDFTKKPKKSKMHFSTTSYVNTANTNKTSKYLTRNKCMFSASTCCPTSQTSYSKAGRPERLILRTRCSLSAIKQEHWLTIMSCVSLISSISMSQVLSICKSGSLPSCIYMGTHSWVSLIPHFLDLLNQFSKYQNKFALTLCELSDSLSFT